jgi:hypothetical protein
MALHYELPVYKVCYDLLLEVFRFTKGFSKEYKYTVGESVGHLEEPRSGGVLWLGSLLFPLAFVRPYFVAPQSDTSTQYPPFGAPCLIER